MTNSKVSILPSQDCTILMANSSPSKRRFDGLTGSSPPHPCQCHRVSMGMDSQPATVTGLSFRPSYQHPGSPTTSSGFLVSTNPLLTSSHPSLPDISQLYQCNTPNTPNNAHLDFPDFPTVYNLSSTLDSLPEEGTEPITMVSLEELECQLEKETHDTWLALQEAMDQDKSCIMALILSAHHSHQSCTLSEVGGKTSKGSYN